MFQTRAIRLANDKIRAIAIAAVQNAPDGIEVVLREPIKARKLDQNALMWAGPLKDLSQQAWVQGRTYSPEVWHEHMKRAHLPEDDDPELPRLVKNPETWRKWDITPGGERVLAGSTTDLTVYGMSQYLEQLYSFGAGQGVMFSAGPR